MLHGSHFIEQCGRLTACQFSPVALGDPAAWPPVLNTAMRMALVSHRPIVVWWGTGLIQLHNHAYGQLTSLIHLSGPPSGKVAMQVDAIMAGREMSGCADRTELSSEDDVPHAVVWSYACTALLDEAGVAGVMAVCEDVTEARAASAAKAIQYLRLAEDAARARRDTDEFKTAQLQRLRMMFEQAPGFMCILDGPDHVFEFANAAFLRLVGGRDLRWKSAREALSDLEGQGFFEKLDEVYRSGTPFVARDVPLSIQREAGTPPDALFVDFVYQPLFGADGRTTGIFVEGFDVTERRVAISAREASEARLKQGMLAARMVVWDWDLLTDRTVFSDNAVAVLGGDWTDVSGVWRSVHPDDLASMAARRAVAMASLGTYEDVIRVNRLDNGNLIWLQVRGTVLAGSDGQPVRIQGVSIDVTERKRAEEALRFVDRRKDQFVAMLAHELRNPLAPIVSAAQILKARSSGDAGARKAAEIVARQAEHMASLIDDVLDVSRFNTGVITLDVRQIDLRQVLADAVEQARPAMNARGHRFAYLPEGAPVAARGDANRLVQAVANLLQNAAKFTPAGGSVELSMACDGVVATIGVRDSGVGIDPDLLPHVFELFTQGERSSERAHGGLGLGLSLVKSLVNLHGGKVSAHSAGPRAGSTFVIELPLAGPHGADSVPIPAFAPAAAARALDILVVDDHFDAARMLRMVLEEGGHRVRGESDPLRVLTRAAEEDIDVFLLDIGLPGMDGNQLARTIRAIPRTASATLVAVTGRGKEYGRAAALAAGFDHYFVKPANVGELLAVLSEIAPRSWRGGLPP
ncbi:PAS domain-containing hybrid sensor histidine kinase/response regulator [Massilia antarctica]|uniref:PAS domain-containing hybrid sensor histidine kinase/response regulator n=1 Tax=Massilia antarctica TaxID=2765360 RepID=UPI0022704006|nr:ATP-binding protein [Massilia sp. H27-R4]MCY0916321.1 ATP-binding protein [Massilia sp. H27-R4]